MGVPAKVGIIPSGVLSGSLDLRRGNIPVASLAEIQHTLSQGGPMPVMDFTPPESLPVRMAVTDFAEIKGQEHVKRALEVASAGLHNMLMVGPPGAGKTLLARALPGILPQRNEKDMCQPLCETSNVLIYTE